MYHVKAFFDAYPEAKEGFETYDHVMHATQELADKWVERHAAKTVTRHGNPAFEVKKQGKPRGKGKENGVTVVAPAGQANNQEGGDPSTTPTE